MWDVDCGLWIVDCVCWPRFDLSGALQVVQVVATTLCTYVLEVRMYVLRRTWGTLKVFYVHVDSLLLHDLCMYLTINTLLVHQRPA
jgi:hypothetical protein